MAEDPEAFGPIARSGANAVILPARVGGGVVALVSKAHESELAALVGFPLFRTGLEGGSRAAAFPNTVGSNVVCPFDWGNWDAVVRCRLRELVSLAAEIPVDGILFDLHLYDSVPASLSDAQCCFCAHCFDTYVRAKDRAVPALRTSAVERFDWLWERGLIRDYSAHLGSRLQRRVRDLIAETVPASVAALLGVLDYEPHWTGEALVDGILEARGSVLALVRAPCNQGYTLETDRVFDRIRMKQGNALCVPGISPAEVSAERLPLELFHLALNSAGYWMALGRQVRDGESPRQPFGNPTPELLLNCQPGNSAIAKWVGGKG